MEPIDLFPLALVQAAVQQAVCVRAHVLGERTLFFKLAEDLSFGFVARLKVKCSSAKDDKAGNVVADSHGAVCVQATQFHHEIPTCLLFAREPF